MDSIKLKTGVMNEAFNVRDRLNQMNLWYEEYEQQYTRLEQRRNQLDIKKPRDLLIDNQIGTMQERIKLVICKEPIDLDAEVIEKLRYESYRQILACQYAKLSSTDRREWMKNFFFILTPDLRELLQKIDKIRAYRSMGQSRNFLLGGPSGMGKTTFLNWYASQYMPTVEEERNYIPVIKIDAPVGNNTPKPLLQRIISEMGQVYLKRDNEEDLLMKISAYLHRCGTELLIVDEVEHIIRHDIRRRLLEVSNLAPKIPIICASCHPIRWIEGDSEVEGRWNDYFELKQYTGRRLSQLLAYLELLLPFTQPSRLADHQIMVDAKREPVNGPAYFIEQWTGGILRDIMILIADASDRAIRQDLPAISLPVLQEAWEDIQTRRVIDFLDFVK